MTPALILSIGHTPESRGACWGDLVEHEEATQWINFISGRLSKYTDIDLYLVEPGSLQEKVERVNRVVNRIKAFRAMTNILAVELHFNSAGETYVEGNETLYHPGSLTGVKAARLFNTSFIEYASKQFNMKIKDRGIKEGWYRQDKPGVRDYAGDVEGDETVNYFLKKTRCASLILEPHFMCELEKLGVNWTQSAIAIAESLRFTTLNMSLPDHS